MGLVALAEAERGGEVAGEHVDLLDVGNQGLVDGLLVSRAAARDLLLLCFLSAPITFSPICIPNQESSSSYLGLLSLLEESLLAGLLLGLLRGEVLGPGDLLNLGLVDASQVDLERGGDDVSRVDAAERDTVDLEGAGNEEDTLVEVLEEDDALAAEPTSEQNQDGAGLERAAGSPGADSLADLEITMPLEPCCFPKIAVQTIASRPKVPKFPVHRLRFACACRSSWFPLPR